VRRSGTFAVLRHRAFRLMLVGGVVSQLGTWAQYVGVGWVARDLSSSTAVVTLAFASQFLPSLLLSPVAGVVADRFDRRAVVLLGNLAMAVPPLAIGVLAQTGHLTVPALIGLVFAGGIALACSQPAGMALTPTLVPPAEIPQAIAANSGFVNLTRVVGPGLGGLVIGTWGVAWGFYLNAVSFAAVVVACLMIDRAPPPAASGEEPFAERFRAGLRYARASPTVSRLLLVALVAAFFTMHAALMPVVARDVLGGDVTTYAQLAAAPGVGAVVGAFVAGRVVGDRLRRRAVVGGTAVLGAVLLVLAVSRSVPLSVGIMTFYGFGYFLQNNVVAAMMTEVTADEFRGRVMGLYGTVMLGMVPVGALGGGALAGLLGVPWTIGLNGAAVLLFTAWFVLAGQARVLTNRPVGERPAEATAAPGAWSDSPR